MTICAAASQYNKRFRQADCATDATVMDQPEEGAPMSPPTIETRATGETQNSVRFQGDGSLRKPCPRDDGALTN